MKRSAILLLFVVSLSSFGVLAAKKSKTESGKAEFIGHRLLDFRPANENFDSIGFDLRMLSGEFGSVKIDHREINTLGNEISWTDSYTAVSEETFMFLKKKTGESDTLRAIRIVSPIRVDRKEADENTLVQAKLNGTMMDFSRPSFSNPLKFMEEGIRVCNDGSTFTIFGDSYGEKLIVSTPDDVVVAETDITGSKTQVEIPLDYEYLLIHLVLDKDTDCRFKYRIIR